MPRVGLDGGVACSDDAPTREMAVQVLRHHGEIYVVGESGSLTSFDPGFVSYRVDLAGERVVALVRARSGALWALATRSSRAQVWSRDGAAWQRAFDVPVLPGDSIFALGEQHGLPVVVLSKAAVTFDARGTPSRVAFSAALPSSLQSECAITEAGFVYVGINAGEWGGGLRRITLATGAVESIERRDGNELCEGPLNASCDPVTAVLVDAREPDCVFASVGLAHMGFTEGRVLRVCGGHVAVDFQPPPLENPAASGNKAMTDPMTALTPMRAGYVASGPSALYVVRDGVGERIPWMTPVKRCGLLVAEAAPGVNAVFTSVNNRRSVSGPMPLLAAEVP
jgi:hypothetical protein